MISNIKNSPNRDHSGPSKTSGVWLTACTCRFCPNHRLSFHKRLVSRTTFSWLSNHQVLSTQRENSHLAYQPTTFVILFQCQTTLQEETMKGLCGEGLLLHPQANTDDWAFYGNTSLTCKPRGVNEGNEPTLNSTPGSKNNYHHKRCQEIKLLFVQTFFEGKSRREGT